MKQSHISKLTAVVLTLLLTACEEETFLDIQTGVELIDGIESYQSSEVVIGMLRLEHDDISTIESSSLPEGDTRPPFTSVSYHIENYSHMGESGDLIVNFFNDRLLAVVFYPNNDESYSKVLAENGYKMREDAHEARPNVMVQKDKDYKEKFCFSWVDKRLEAQANRWLSLYS